MDTYENDPKRVFFEEIGEKSSIGRSACHRVCGSRSKRCDLMSDNMTESEWKRRNGKMIVAKMNAPVTLHEFDSWSEDIQREYITNLVNRFGATRKQIAAMFGCCPATAASKLSGFGIQFQKGRSMSRAELELWEDFLRGEIMESESTPAEHITEQTEQTVSIKNITMEITGDADWSAVFATLKAITGNCPGKITITYER